MSSIPSAAFPNSAQQENRLKKEQRWSAASTRTTAERRYRSVRGHGITLHETRHNSGDGNNNGAIEYLLRDESRVGPSAFDLALLALVLALWITALSPVYFTLGLLVLGLVFANLFLSNRINKLLLVESVGVHIINKKTIFGAREEYLPWNSISDVFINEVISEQKVLYYLTFIVKELTSNGTECTRLIPLFRDLKPERKCLEYMYVRLADSIGKTKTKNLQ